MASKETRSFSARVISSNVFSRYGIAAAAAAAAGRRLRLAKSRGAVGLEPLAEKSKRSQRTPIRGKVAVLVPVDAGGDAKALSLHLAHERVETTLDEGEKLGSEVLAITLAVEVVPRVANLFVRAGEEILDAVRELRVGEVSGDVEHAVEVLALVDLAAVVRVDGAEPRPGLLLGHGLAHAGGNLQRLDHVDAAAAVLVDGVEHHGEGVASVEGSPDGHNARL